MQLQDAPAEETTEAVSIQLLPKLPPHPWRSLGQIFNYSTWPERERFVQLDRELAKVKAARLLEFWEGDNAGG